MSQDAPDLRPTQTIFRDLQNSVKTPITFPRAANFAAPPVNPFLYGNGGGAGESPKIAIINIMDNAEGTEKHFLKILKKAAPDAAITLCRLDCTELGEKYFTEYEYLLSARYQSWREALEDDFDLVIVTGINRGRLSYPELIAEYPDFWQEMVELFAHLHQATKTGQVGHAHFVCWSAFAAMKSLYGIEKYVGKSKHYGLFAHEVADKDHPLLKNILQGGLLVPHSRYSHIDEQPLRTAIARHGGLVLMDCVNGDGGPAIWTLEEGRLSCSINHLEYGIDTLHREYLRDSARDVHFPWPHCYPYHPRLAGPVDESAGESAGENEFLQAIFDRLSEVCASFYGNLVAHGCALHIQQAESRSPARPYAHPLPLTASQ